MEIVAMDMKVREVFQDFCLSDNLTLFLYLCTVFTLQSHHFSGYGALNCLPSAKLAWGLT